VASFWLPIFCKKGMLRSHGLAAGGNHYTRVIDQFTLLLTVLFRHNPMSCHQTDNACVCRDMYMRY